MENQTLKLYYNSLQVTISKWLARFWFKSWWNVLKRKIYFRDQRPVFMEVEENSSSMEISAFWSSHSEYKPLCIDVLQKWSLHPFHNLQTYGGLSRYAISITPRQLPFEVCRRAWVFDTLPTLKKQKSSYKHQFHKYQNNDKVWTHGSGFLLKW